MGSIDKISLNGLVIFENIKVLEILKINGETIGVNDLTKFDIKCGDSLLIDTGWSIKRYNDEYFQRNP